MALQRRRYNFRMIVTLNSQSSIVVIPFLIPAEDDLTEEHRSMVNEDGIAELRRRSVRVAAVRRYSKHTAVHRRSAEGGGGTLPALPLAAIQDRWSTEALRTRTLTLTLNLAVTLSPCPGPDPNPSPGSIRSPSPTALGWPFLALTSSPRRSTDGRPVSGCMTSRWR